METRDTSKDFWVPATPAKPHQDPGCTYQHRNKKDQTSNFVPPHFCQENEQCQASTMSPLPYGTGFHKSDGRSSWNKPVEETTQSGLEKPSVQISENSGYNVFSMESVDRTIPFCHLLALADAAASGSNSYMSSTTVAQTEDKGAKGEHEENNPPTSELVVENSNYVTGLTESTGKNTTPQQKHHNHEENNPPDSKLVVENRDYVTGLTETTGKNTTPQQKPRRKKYMPKVMREGQSMRTPKPKTPNAKTPRPANPNDDPTAKRKDVGMKGVNMTPNTPIVDLTQINSNIHQETLSVELSDITRNIHPDTLSVNSNSKSACRSRSCRRMLNFDTDYQVREETSSCSHASEYDWNSGAWSWKRNVDKGQVEQIADVRSESTRGRCCTVFSNVNHVKESEIVQMIDLNSQPVPRSPDASNCSTTTPLTWGEQSKRKRGHSSAADEDFSSTNMIGAHHNSVQAYQPLFPVDQCCISGTPHLSFPTIHRKKRTEKCQKSVTSIIEQTKEYSPKGNWGRAFTLNSCHVSFASQCNDSNPATRISDIEDAQDETLSFRLMLAAGSKGTKKKRSMSATRVRDIASLVEIVESLQPERTSIMQVGSYNKPETREGKITKKRTKRNTLASGSMKKNMFSVDMLVEHLRHLDINAERLEVADPNMSAISSYSTLYQEQNAIVVYQRDGTLVPIKKRTRRPRVNLDEETIRVWNLLLQDINSEGINGTDEDKEKWWEEERRLFRERAMSFIDRMHLIQGDRRFSKWKGSVVDSVVGVFLTQNVSDHLSSSAFMAVAARFPPNLKRSDSEVEGNCSWSRPINTEVSVQDPDDTFIWQGLKSEQSTLDQRPMVIEDVTSNESTVSSISGDRPNDVSSCNFLDTAGRSFVELLRIAETTNYIAELARFSGIQKAGKENFSSEAIRSSRETASQSTVQQIVTLDSHEASKASPENYLPHCSFQAESDIVCQPPTTSGDLKYELELSNQEKIDQVECVISEKNPGTLDVTGGTNDFNDSRMNAQKEAESSPSNHDALYHSRMNGQKEAESSPNNHDAVSHTTPSDKMPKAKRGRKGKGKQTAGYWDNLRKTAQINGERGQTADTMDSVNWEAVRRADVEELAYTIRERGMNNMLAERIKEFLDRLLVDHGSIDLEWLRDVPPDQAKEYLLSFRGLGLKSVECVRLLTLHHVAFPVDTNVGRIAVRLGWVPLQPLPESLQLHLLELYPVLESIQKYLWPRLCKLDQRTLYELHYQMITFGKVFCTKSKPNCNACPMRGECRHFASAFASARLALPAPEEKDVAASKYITANQNPTGTSNRLPEPVSHSHQLLEVNSFISDCEPVIEVPTSPEPIIEVPATPEPEREQLLENDIEDFYHENPEEIPTIKLNIEEFTQTLQEYMQKNMELQEGDVSKALVALTPEAASIPAVKLKNVNQLRTEHQVYELPDTHPLLDGLDRREPDDPCKYLLAIWTPGETADSVQPPRGPCINEESGGLCSDDTCFACSSTREAQSQTVRGTLLIPCRTAMRGSFPLNGTYFQVNEVFADHESSLNPIDVPRSWLWKLPRKTVFFGTSIPSIFKGLTTEGIQFCFWKGFVCVRGFERQSRAPRPLIARLHFPASKLARGKGKRETQ